MVELAKKALSAKRYTNVVSLLIRPDANRRLDAMANLMQTSKAAVIRQAIDEFLAKKMSAAS